MTSRTPLLAGFALGMLASLPSAQVKLGPDTAPPRRRLSVDVVAGYYPYWVHAGQPPASIDLGLMTQVAHAFVWPDAAGGITAPAGFFAVDLPGAAHAVGTEALLSVGGGGTSDGFSAMCADPIARATFIVNLLGLVTTWGYDGVNLDWEFPASLADKVNLVTLAAELRQALGSQAVLNIAVPAGDWSGKWFDVALADHVDHLQVMAYDFNGSWSAFSDHNAPLYPGVCGSSGGWVDLGVSYWLNKGVPARQLVLGMPFYGTSYDSQTLCAAFTSSSQATYAQLHPLSGAGYTYQWDALAQAPLLFEDAGSVVWSFDDPASVAAKATYARDSGLGGVMIWHVAGDVVGGEHKLLPAVVGALR